MLLTEATVLHTEVTIRQRVLWVYNCTALNARVGLGIKANVPNILVMLQQVQFVIGKKNYYSWSPYYLLVISNCRHAYENVVITNTSVGCILVSWTAPVTSVVRYMRYILGISDSYWEDIQFGINHALALALHWVIDWVDWKKGVHIFVGGIQRKSDVKKAPLLPSDRSHPACFCKFLTIGESRSKWLQ